LDQADNLVSEAVAVSVSVTIVYCLGQASQQAHDFELIVGAGKHGGLHSNLRGA
jgi:hypothetical protein